MLDRLFPDHLKSLELGLDRATKRQGLLMTNLANSNVPGYKRKDMDFTVALDDAMGKPGHMIGGSDSGGQMEEDEGSVRIDGSSVDPERESLGIAETELRYQAITDITAGWFANMKSVIREGK